MRLLPLLLTVITYVIQFKRKKSKTNQQTNKMKVATMSMFLLLGKSISALGGNSLLGRDLAKLYASDDSARKLASCYDVVMAAEQLMDQISGNTASCSSISNEYFCSVKFTVDTL